MGYYLETFFHGWSLEIGVFFIDLVLLLREQSLESRSLFAQESVWLLAQVKVIVLDDEFNDTVVLLVEYSFALRLKFPVESIHLSSVCRLLFFIYLFVFHEHGGDRQVEHEKSNDPYAGNEKHLHKKLLENVQVDLHDFCPLIHGWDDKNSQEWACNIVKIGKTVIKFGNVGVDPQVWLVELILGAIVIQLLEARSTEVPLGAFGLIVAAQVEMGRVEKPLSVFRLLG